MPLLLEPHHSRRAVRCGWLHRRGYKHRRPAIVFLFPWLSDRAFVLSGVAASQVPTGSLEHGVHQTLLTLTRVANPGAGKSGVFASTLSLFVVCASWAPKEPGGGERKRKQPGRGAVEKVI
jgi:hypothetical protein